MGIFDMFKKKKDEYDEINGEGLQPGSGEFENEPEEPAGDGIIADTGDEMITPESDPDMGDSKNKTSFFEKLKAGLTKTRDNITGKIINLAKSGKKLDDDFWEEMEDILIQADCGFNTAMELVENMKKTVRKNKINDSAEIIGLLKQEVAALLGHTEAKLNMAADMTTIILVVGVNGAGKTTSIAKLAYRFKESGQKVLLAAADTFRAAAIDQLQIWADRVGVEIIKHQEGADPGAVVYDAINAARARRADVLIIDTAGRLQNKTNLMKEIGKVRKIIEREQADAPHEVLLVLDASTGQNAISQAVIFEEATGVTGIILTKLDGTAKGGIVLAIARELNIPVKLVGIGEKMEDLRDFSPDIFVQALLDE